ncbi:MAG: ribonuclease H-like domain-containing protein [Halobacteria archaeon]|nr:ribonuclease H-like domain-containing protein [Halobacteria archaeon]
MRIQNSFIPVRGVGEKTERKLWKNGVTTWEEFEETGLRHVGETTAERVLDYIDEARDRLDRGDASFFGDSFPSGEEWRLYSNFDDETCFLDIETTGLSKEDNRVTTVSFHVGDETQTLVRGEDLGRSEIERRLSEASLLVTFNGKRFDVPFLEHSFGLDVETPHIDLMYPCRRLDPSLSGGLKAVEDELGVERPGSEEVDGADAVRLWHRYEDGDDEALEKLVRYNRYDTRNLRQVLDEVHSRLSREVFDPHVSV